MICHVLFFLCISFNEVDDNGGGMFVYNENSYFLVKESSFVGNFARSSGAGINFNNGNHHFVFESTKFQNNSVWLYGGGVAFGQYNSDIDFLDCEFSNNVASYDGGGVNFYQHNMQFTFSRCLFAKNIAVEGAGINFYALNSYIICDDCDFLENSARSIGAGVLARDRNQFVKVVNSRFLRNAALYGGAIYLKDDNHDFVLENSDIIGNIASVGGSSSDGGGVYVDTYNERVVIKGCLLSDNVASFEGGGIYLNLYNNNLTISDSVIVNNMAVSGGGGAFIFSFNENITITNVTFSMNSALTVGGGLFIHTENSNMKILDSFFNNNTSGDHGGGFAMSQDNFNVDFVNVEVKFNDARGVGGGGYLWQKNDFVSFHNCLFMGNTAFFDGGGLYAYRYNNFITLVQSQFNANQALSDDGGGVFIKYTNNYMFMSGCRFYNNSAETGGGAVIIRRHNEYVYIENSSFWSNRANNEGGAIHSFTANSYMTFTNVEFRQNQADVGGGLFLGDDDYFSLLDSTFLSNSARRGGGAIMGFYARNALIAGCSFARNTASTAGGLLVRSENVMLKSSIFQMNEALDSGGAYVSTRDGLVHNCTFTSNIATGVSGGLIISESVNVLLTDLVFHNNEARTAGGGVGIGESENITVRGASFFSNIGAEGGGMLIALSDDVVVEDSTFTSCSGLRGAAMKLTTSDRVVIKNNTFRYNLAQSSGALFILDSDFVHTYGNNFNGNVADRLYGSAIVFLRSREAILKNSFFSNNSAPYNAGTVYWTTWDSNEPDGLTGPSNTFTDSNTALYGKFWATEGVMLKVRSDTNVLHIEDYDRHVPPFEVYLVDYYDQVVKTDSTSYVEIFAGEDHSCADTAGFVGGGVVGLLKDGVANFTDVDVTCAPGYNQSLELYIDNSDIINAVPYLDIVVSFRHCRRGEFYQDYMCQTCPTGTFSFTESRDLFELQQNKVCQRCPEEATLCFGDVIVLDQGYWRSSDTNDYIVECPFYESACIGGPYTSDESCQVGYMGPLCAVCEDNYHFSSLSQTCDLCSDKSSWIGSAMISFFLVVVCCGLLWFALREKKKAGVSTFTELLVHYLVKWNYISAIDQDNAKLEWVTEYIRLNVIKRLQVRFRIYVTFYQILEILPFVLDLSFPSFYNAVASMMAILNLDFSTDTLSASDCSNTLNTKHDFIDKLLFSTIYPFVVVGAICIVYYVHVYSRKRTSAAQGEDLSRDDVWTIYSKYQKICLIFISLTLPAISSVIFATFSCTDVDSETPDRSEVYMTVDYTVECYTDRYYFAFSWALVMVVVYPIGVPLYYFYILHKHRYDIIRRDRTASNMDLKMEGIKFLYEVYKPCYWFWEVIEMYFRLSMTGLLVLLDQGSTLQIIVGIFFSLLFIKLYDISQPYVDEENKYVKEVSLWQIFFIFAFAFGLKTKMLDDASDGVIVFLLAVIIFINLMFDVVKLLKYLFIMRSRRLRAVAIDMDNADIMSVQMSANQLDQELIETQMRLAELVSIKKKKLQTLWRSSEGRKHGQSKNVSGAGSNDEVVMSPLSRDSNGIELNEIKESNML